MFSKNKANLCLVCFLVVVISCAVAEYGNSSVSRKLKEDPEPSPSPNSTESSSMTELSGWFKLHAVGTGKKCLEKEKVKSKSEKEQFGDTATAEAFLGFFGTPECEEGEKGNSKCKVRAWIVAKAYSGGKDCVASVLGEIAAKCKDNKPHPDVTVTAGGFAIGEATVTCP